MVFDPVTKRFFVSDPGRNRIVALDAVTETEIASIRVPGAFGIDETPDHSTLYAGTQIGDVYAIDPVAMQVTHRYLAARIGPGGFAAYSTRVLADGDLVLLGSLGFYLRLKTADGMKGTRINYPHEVRTPEETRKALIEMVGRSKTSPGGASS